MTTSPSKKEIRQIKELFKLLVAIAYLELGVYIMINYPELTKEEQKSIILSNDPIEASTWLSN